MSHKKGSVCLKADCMCVYTCESVCDIGRDTGECFRRHLHTYNYPCVSEKFSSFYNIVGIIRDCDSVQGKCTYHEHPCSFAAAHDVIIKQTLAKKQKGYVKHTEEASDWAYWCTLTAARVSVQPLVSLHPLLLYYKPQREPLPGAIGVIENVTRNWDRISEHKGKDLWWDGCLVI